MPDLSDIIIVPGPSKEQLNERQLTDYRHHRANCLEWLLAMGKNPKKADGYAFQTVKSRGHRMDMFYRWVGDQEEGYTADITTEHADEYLRELALSEYSEAHKSSCQKALQMLFKWRHHELGGDRWEPKIRFSSGDDSSNPRDHLDHGGTETDPRGRPRVRIGAVLLGPCTRRT